MRDVERPDPQFVERLWARLELEAFGPAQLEPAAAVAVRRHPSPRRALLIATAAAVVTLLVLSAGTLQTDPRAQTELDVARMLPTPAPSVVDASVPEAVPQDLPVGPFAQVAAPAQAAAPVPVPVPQPAPAPDRAVAPGVAARELPPPATSVDELLFFYREDPENRVGVPFDVARMALDGQERVVLLTGNNDGHDIFPDWAPDGQRIVFASRNRDDHGHVQLYVREADGTERRLTQSRCDGGQMACGDSDAAWSPTGEVIAFTRGAPYPGCDPAAGDCGTIMLVPAQGGVAVSLTRGWRPSWSPDGQQLVFVSTADDVSRASCDGVFVAGCAAELFVINRDGSGLRPLGVQGGEPRWSPDGRRIAYSATTDGSVSSVRIVAVDGTGDAPLTGPGHAEPAWSPDGRAIATSKSTGGQYDLWSTDVDTGDSTQLTRTPAIERSPVFRPRPR